MKIKQILQQRERIVRVPVNIRPAVARLAAWLKGRSIVQLGKIIRRAGQRGSVAEKRVARTKTPSAVAFWAGEAAKQSERRSLALATAASRGA